MVKLGSEAVPASRVPVVRPGVTPVTASGVRGRVGCGVACPGTRAAPRLKAASAAAEAVGRRNRRPPSLVLSPDLPRSMLVIDRIRAIYPALSEAVAASWVPLAVAMAALILVFRVNAAG